MPEHAIHVKCYSFVPLLQYDSVPSEARAAMPSLPRCASGSAPAMAHSHKLYKKGENGSVTVSDDDLDTL